MRKQRSWRLGKAAGQKLLDLVCLGSLPISRVHLAERGQRPRFLLQRAVKPRYGICRISLSQLDESKLGGQGCVEPFFAAPSSARQMPRSSDPPETGGSHAAKAYENEAPFPSGWELEIDVTPRPSLPHRTRATKCAPRARHARA